MRADATAAPAAAHPTEAGRAVPDDRALAPVPRLEGIATPTLRQSEVGDHIDTNDPVLGRPPIVASGHPPPAGTST